MKILKKDFFHQNVSLQPLHSMHFQVKADYYAEIKVIDELLSILPNLNEFEKIFWLGGGNNTIFLRDYEGLVLKISTKGIQFVSETKDEITIKVEAGENWNEWVQFCLKQNWYGLENLILIPGTVGAAPIQNIGAYGVEVKDFIEQIECIDLTNGKFFRLNSHECQFSYRNSIFKQKEAKNWVVLAVLFKLKKRFNPILKYQELQKLIINPMHLQEMTAEKLANCICQLRASKLPNPDLLGNSGSFFHNPILDEDCWIQMQKRFINIPFYEMPHKKYKIAAGWMIEQLGLKGFKIGGMAVYQKQALVIVNEHQGKPEELLELVAIIKDAVYHQFNINLTIEPQLI